LLLPLAGFYGLVTALRRLAYRRRWLSSDTVDIPVIVVGNLQSGGSGKTPLVIALVELLRAQGWRPGVISRGYGGRVRGPEQVKATSLPEDVGDEPVLIARKTAAPVAIARDRAAAARLLCSESAVDILVADDGLQHYRLARTLELVVLDAEAPWGNGWLLPAGPLRESRKRLNQADAVLTCGSGFAAELPIPVFAVNCRAAHVYPLHQPGLKLPPQPPGTAPEWLAVAGIARPERFFATLHRYGWRFQTRVFSDHHRFSLNDTISELPIVMTEKDAIKCQNQAITECWVLSWECELSQAFSQWLESRLSALKQVRDGRHA
jgi:tetraacyldisaccharide 4'-kinase